MPYSISGESTMMSAMPSGMKVDQMPMAITMSAGRAATAMIFGAVTATAV